MYVNLQPGCIYISIYQLHAYDCMYDTPVNTCNMHQLLYIDINIIILLCINFNTTCMDQIIYNDNFIKMKSLIIEI